MLVAGLVAATGLALTPAPARAAGKRIAVLMPGGAEKADAPIAARMAKALKQHKVQSVTGGPVKKAVEKDGPPSSDGDWVKLARKLKVDGLLESTLSLTGSTHRIEIVVHNGADGSVAGRADFAGKGSAKKLAAAVGKGLWKKLGAFIKDTTAPAKGEEGLPAHDLGPGDESANAAKTEEPTPVGEPATEAGGGAGAAEPAKPPEAAAPPAEETKAPEETGMNKEAEGQEAEPEEKPPVRRRPTSPEGEGHGGEPRALEIEVDARFLRRVFQYVPSSAARYYLLNFVPVVAGQASWYPITYAGLFVSGEFNGALKTGTSPAFPTSTRELVGGAQGRIPFSWGQLGLSVAYFQHLFRIVDTSSTSDAARSSLPWPNTTYQGARIALNGRLRLGDRVLLGAEGAYRLVTNPGEKGNEIRSDAYFPQAKVSVGVEGAAFVSVGIVSWLEIRGGVDYRRYVFGKLARGMNNNTVSSDPTGATDDYLALNLGLVGVFGGK